MESHSKFHGSSQIGSSDHHPHNLLGENHPFMFQSPPTIRQFAEWDGQDHPPKDI
jgi:hypothetical protein